MSIIMELFNQSREKNKILTDEDFWELIESLDREYIGDSDAVISALVKRLRGCEDEYIFSFDDMLCELIYSLDGKKWADELFGSEPFSEDKFLSARCDAVARGMNHYSKVLGHRERLSGKNIHEYGGKWHGAADSLILAAPKAWALKHIKDPHEYPHKSKFSLASHSNSEMWDKK